MRRPALLALAVAAALTAGSAGSPAQAAAPLPVPWDASAFISGGQSPDTAPGANDWSCRPSAEHPRPVILVHGLAASLGANWATMSPLLKNNGFCVFGLTYGRQPGDQYNGGFTLMEQSSEELRALVDKVLRATGAAQVDLLGHSEGTVMPRWYLSFLGGAPKVRRYVQYTPLWQGTNLAFTADLSELGSQGSPGFNSGIAGAFSTSCASCPEFVRGSEYLNKVNAAGPAVKGIEYTEIATKYDELVSPYTSGLLYAPHVKDYVLQDVCPTDFSEHAAVAYDPVAAQLALNALDPARAAPVPCPLVLTSGTPNPPNVGLAPASHATTPSQTPAPHARRACVSGRFVRVTVAGPRAGRVRSITVYVNGRKLSATHGARSHVDVSLIGRPRGTFRVKIVISVTRAGSSRRITEVRTFHTCRPGPRRAV